MALSLGLQIKHSVRSLPSRSPQPNRATNTQVDIFNMMVWTKEKPRRDNHRCPGELGGPTFCLCPWHGCSRREKEGEGKHLRINAKVSFERARVELLCAQRYVT